MEGFRARVKSVEEQEELKMRRLVRLVVQDTLSVDAPGVNLERNAKVWFPL